MRGTCWHARSAWQPSMGESVEVVYRVVGKGTEQFSRLRDNDTVRLMGPLGNGFTLPEAGHGIGHIRLRP